MKAFLKSMNLQRNKNPSAITVGSIQDQETLNVDMHGDEINGTMNGGEGQGGDPNNPASKTNMLTPMEKRKLGKMYRKDQALEEVVASEMSRVRQAFDVRLGEHTEELVTKVNSGEAIGEKTGASKKK